jgi:hypothetical protein
MIASSMAGEWKYSKKFQEQIHDYPDESILDVKFNAPINRSYSYTIRHAELAYAYLRDQQVYLEHLN